MPARTSPTLWGMQLGADDAPIHQGARLALSSLEAGLRLGLRDLLGDLHMRIVKSTRVLPWRSGVVAC